MARPPSLASALTLSTIALTFRTIAKLTSKEFRVDGLPILLDALRIGHDEKGKGRMVEGGESDESVKPRRGIVTVCNHNSVVDDPMMWSLMPLTTYFPFATPSHTCRNTRWTLGASDIMFTNRFNNKFFDLGQVIETHRGGGIFQPAVDRAVKLLQDGEWIHIFPEGKVNQQGTNADGGLLRFKWGVGRIIMDSKVMPEIIPMWISGFDQVMPEPRNRPRFIPRPGAKLSITVGQPLTSAIEPLVSSWREMAEKESGTLGVGGDWEQGSQGTGLVGDAQREVRGKGELIDGREQQVRMKIVDVLQQGVAKLGEEVERREGRYEKGLWTQSKKFT
ncbi:hypothetical protein CI109_100339 [Kwoniella shandongensis]|uniref:Tafazzin family protein n=1 Tax=Kwoniella shandongensis TaxID=1734106 RepID=A0A5M6C8Y4_9TREE|nr:uncharacterized protein CI109_001815 [Kwoniella shandongensis]KAA5529875.1 hypothetical protein CI109_001815 [Kwoniella shandongensis]